MTLMWIIGAGIVASFFGVLAAALLLLFPSKMREFVLPSLIGYATGALLAASLLDLFPEALERLPLERVVGALLGGILLFFLLEKLVIWRHCHDGECESHHAAAPMILIGDAVHNFLDGVVVAAAFLVSVPLGITTTIAVVSHELPQEVGDFAILLEAGYSRRKALFWNLASGAATLAGGLLAYLFLRSFEFILPYVMAVAAASFLYIAMSDLVPHLHKQTYLRHGVRQVFFIAIGIATIWLLLP